MAGYAKMWTTIRHNKEFLSLSLHERGAFLQLIVAAKDQGDNGIINYRNIAAMGHDLGCNFQTGDKIVTKLKQICNWGYTKNDDGTVSVKIPNYKKWQELGVAELLQNRYKSVTKMQPLRPDQTKPDYTKPEQTIEPHKDFLEFIEKNKKRIFDRLSQIAFRILGSEQELWDKTICGKMAPWIRENPEKAGASLTRVHCNDWILFIERWVWRDWKKKKAEIDGKRGMSPREETEHYERKRMENAGRGSSEPVDIASILPEVKSDKLEI